VGIEKNSGIAKIKQAFKLLKESLKELDEVEYLLELLEKELNDYRNLIDKESYIPKAKFIKQRICRLIERMKFISDESLACVGIKISLIGEIPDTDRRSIINYIATYVDGHIRPYDMLFMMDESLLGIIFPLKSRSDLDSIIKRLETMLLNLKAKTYSDRNVLINFKIGHFFIERDSTADQVFEKLREMKGGA
jgi:hypothetical protein